MIDTQNKRRSVGSHQALTTLPAPTGAVTVGDRAHVCWVYRAFAFADAVLTGGAGALRRPGRPGLWL